MNYDNGYTSVTRGHLWKFYNRSNKLYKVGFRILIKEF